MLLEAGEPFFAHAVNIFTGENYDPLYVRTRAQACGDAGLPLAATHTGSTSVVGAGCDACVVPTLIVRESDEVLVDSLHICCELSRRFGGELRAPELADLIDREIAIVDGLPNYPLLAAKVAKPAANGAGNSFAMRKVERCDALIAEFADDRLLVAAYTAKRDKELSGNNDLFTPDAIAGAEQAMQLAFSKLERRIPAGRDFLFGDRLSLADIFWAIVLIRTEDLGYGNWIGRLPRLSTYYQTLSAAPAIRTAILDWPGARIELPSKA